MNHRAFGRKRRAANISQGAVAARARQFGAKIDQPQVSRFEQHGMASPAKRAYILDALEALLAETRQKSAA